MTSSTVETRANVGAPPISVDEQEESNYLPFSKYSLRTMKRRFTIVGRLL